MLVDYLLAKKRHDDYLNKLGLNTGMDKGSSNIGGTMNNMLNRATNPQVSPITTEPKTKATSKPKKKLDFGTTTTKKVLPKKFTNPFDGLNNTATPYDYALDARGVNEDHILGLLNKLVNNYSGSNTNMPTLDLPTFDNSKQYSAGFSGRFNKVLDTILYLGKLGDYTKLAFAKAQSRAGNKSSSVNEFLNLYKTLVPETEAFNKHSAYYAQTKPITTETKIKAVDTFLKNLNTSLGGISPEMSLAIARGIAPELYSGINISEMLNSQNPKSTNKKEDEKKLLNNSRKL